jgi:hypothetical protein
MAALDSQKKFDALIVSVFGRGHWLANHLLDQGWRVALVDLTAQMGDWQPDDYDGPFGLCETERISPSQKKEWLQSGDSNLSTHYSLLLREGPLEGGQEVASPLQKSVPEFARAYVREFNESRKPYAAAVVARHPFSQTWFAQLSHQLASAVYEENHRAFKVGHGLPFFAPYILRELSSGSHESALRTCEKKGVQVFRGTQINALKFASQLGSESFRSAIVDGQEIEAGSAVWLLSSEETESLGVDLRKKLYKNKRAHALWCWLRFEVRLKQNSLSEVLPNSFSLVADLYQPWTHTNLVHFRRKKSEREKWNIWLRLPAQFRFDLKYLQKIKQQLEENLKERWPLCEPQVTELPLEAGQSAQRFKAPRFPVFLKEELKDLKIYQARNFFVSGVEKWLGLDPLSFLESQRDIVIKLENLKRLTDERALKRQEKMEQKQR